MNRTTLTLLSLTLLACDDRGGHPAPAPDAAPGDAQASARDGAPNMCDQASALFETRIAPLLVETRPSSCNGCHLSGVDLEDFVRGTACQSMACLLEREMVDFDEPADSKILALMVRGASEGDSSTRAAALVEHRAFAEWIAHSARCHQENCGEIVEACGPRIEPDAGPPDAGLDASPDGSPVDGGAPGDGAAADGPFPDGPFPDGELPDGPLPDAEPPDPCAETALQDLFEARVWTWHNRCYHCHQGDGVGTGPGGAPTWMETGHLRDSADSTYHRIVARGYLDLEAPDQSLLLLKPLAEAVGGIEHRGGAKFLSLDDPAYLDFRDWIWTYAACENPELMSPHPPRDAGVDESE